MTARGVIIAAAPRGIIIAAAPRGIIIAAPRSGSGKTTVTLALVAALRRRGVAVRVAKSGPDYIDPAFHAAASGHDCINLDSWAMPGALLDRLVGTQAAAADFLVIEASMGLFDGVGEVKGARGSAADLAARFGLPVVLVLDVSGQSQSAAAVALGFAGFDPAVRLAGVVLNRVGSARHRDGIGAAMAAVSVPVLGVLARDAAIGLPERHLGLVQAGEQDGLEGYLAGLADRAERDFDLPGIMAACAPIGVAPGAAVPVRPVGQRIAVAQDAAFGFMYPHVVHGWRAAGAEISWFSPLANEAPPADCDACWLPGGYPELHAGRLAAASGFLDGLRQFAAHGIVHGECGGFMVLGTTIEDAEGVCHRMAGLLGHETSFARRRLHLGYREAVLCADCGLGSAGTRLRGHEFHYASTTVAGEDAPLAMIADGAGQALGAAGARRLRVSGSFFHVIAGI